MERFVGCNLTITGGTEITAPHGRKGVAAGRFRYRAATGRGADDTADSGFLRRIVGGRGSTKRAMRGDNLR